MVHSVALGIAGCFRHCNIDLRYEFLNYVFSANEIHRLFGTYYNVPGERPKVIGMVHEEGYPIHSYPKQLLAPFTYRRTVK